MPENIKCLRIPKRQMQFFFRVSLLDWDAIDHCKTFFCSFPNSQTFEKFIGTNEVLIPLFGAAWCKLNSRIMACAINRSMQQKDIACKNGESYFWNQGNAFFPSRTHSCYVCTKWTKIWSTKPIETEMPSLKYFFFPFFGVGRFSWIIKSNLFSLCLWFIVVSFAPVHSIIIKLANVLLCIHFSNKLSIERTNERKYHSPCEYVDR